MREGIFAHHHADRLKAIFIIASSMLESYGRAGSREELIHDLFDNLEREINTAEAVLSGDREKEKLEEARLSLHRALEHFNTGEVEKSREQLAKAVSSFATVAEKSMRELGL